MNRYCSSAGTSGLDVMIETAAIGACLPRESRPHSVARLRTSIAQVIPPDLARPDDFLVGGHPELLVPGALFCLVRQHQAQIKAWSMSAWIVVVLLVIGNAP